MSGKSGMVVQKTRSTSQPCTKIFREGDFFFYVGVVMTCDITLSSNLPHETGKLGEKVVLGPWSTNNLFAGLVWIYPKRN